MSAPLSAWPLPYRAAGRLNVAFATASGVGGGPGAAEVALYDASGRLVRRIAKGLYPAGVHVAGWDGRDERGRAVAPGVYFLRASTAGQGASLKVIVLK